MAQSKKKREEKKRFPDWGIRLSTLLPSESEVERRERGLLARIELCELWDRFFFSLPRYVIYITTDTTASVGAIAQRENCLLTCRITLVPELQGFRFFLSLV